MKPLEWWPRLDGVAGGRAVDGWGERADQSEVLARVWYQTGAIVEIIPLAYGVRLCLVNHFERCSYEDVWCYRSLVQALAWALEWNGAEGSEPAGWFRHPTSGRRRENGDPALEEIRY